MRSTSSGAKASFAPVTTIVLVDDTFQPRLTNAQSYVCGRLHGAQAISKNLMVGCPVFHDNYRAQLARLKQAFGDKNRDLSRNRHHVCSPTNGDGRFSLSFGLLCTDLNCLFGFDSNES